MGLRSAIKHMSLFAIGGVIYYILELLWRGHSAWQMFLVGGICFLLIGFINEVYPWSMPLWLQPVIATGIVTSVEFVSGLIFNVWLGLKIWDYSNLPYNLYGQVCLYFSLLWLVLSPIAIVLDDWLRHWMFEEEDRNTNVFRLMTYILKDYSTSNPFFILLYLKRWRKYEARWKVYFDEEGRA